MTPSAAQKIQPQAIGVKPVSSPAAASPASASPIPSALVLAMPQAAQVAGAAAPSVPPSAAAPRAHLSRFTTTVMLMGAIIAVTYVMFMVKTML